MSMRIVKKIRTATAMQVITFKNREFLNSPITSSLLIKERFILIVNGPTRGSAPTYIFRH